MASGIVLINKPAGPTSHDIVDEMRRITGIRKIGHAGTLDPFAKGLLVVLVGREATKRQSEFLTKDKEYLAVLKLGAETDSYDKTGKITNIYKGKLPAKKEIEAALKKFKGEILQTPPAYSAKKVKGKKAYQLARQGKEVKLEPVHITIKEIKITKYKPPYLKLKIKCGAGTYIRALARDIGKTLGCGAYLEELIRVKSGNFSLKDALSLSEFTPENWQEALIGVDKRQ
jgi:tRNA pseudouridine55 synthase